MDKRMESLKLLSFEERQARVIIVLERISHWLVWVALLQGVIVVKALNR